MNLLGIQQRIASPLWGGTKILGDAQRAAEFLGGGLIGPVPHPNFHRLFYCFTAVKQWAQKFVPPHKGEAKFFLVSLLCTFVLASCTNLSENYNAMDDQSTPEQVVAADLAPSAPILPLSKIVFPDGRTAQDIQDRFGDNLPERRDVNSEAHP